MNEWEFVPFGEAVVDSSSGNKKIQRSDYSKSGELAIVDQGAKLIGGYTDDTSAAYRGKLPVIIFGDHTRNFKYVDFPFALGADGVKVLAPKSDFHPKFLYYYLRSLKVPSAGYSRHFKYLKGHRIAKPSLAEQCRIAEMLDRVDHLQLVRHESLHLLDELAQSVFFDMFGDPVRNENGWPRVPLDFILDRIDSGHSPVCLDRPARAGEWGVLKLGAVTTREYLPEENKMLPDLNEVNPANEVHPGDFLFSRKNTRELVGASALVTETPPRLLMPDLIFRLVLKPEAPVNKWYLHRLLTYATKYRLVRELARGSAGSMPNISKARLMDFRVEIPPLDLQDKFAQRIQAIARQKLDARTHAKVLDDLFESLQHRAFRGDRERLGDRRHHADRQLGRQP